VNTIMEWVVVVLLAAWFAVTVAYQPWLARLMPLARRWDVFRVVPSWHLYTDIPRSLRLYYRDRDAAGGAGKWREISLRCCDQPGHALFNPAIFAPDAVASLLEFLCDAVERPEPPSPGRLVKTIGWQGVWLRVAGETVAADTVARQFEVRRQALAPGSPEERVYASEFVPLPAAKGAA
jgi:hypothetical protein